MLITRQEKCLKCGGWRQMQENPTEKDQIATGMMMNLPEPPANVCSCNADGEGDASEN